MAGRGRPHSYTIDIGTELLGRLSKGEPLTVICRDENMPAYRTVSAWKETVEGFDADFARARDEGFDAIAADALKIADHSEHDTIDTDFGPKANMEWIARSKLRVETRFKLLSKWDPKRYGERVELRHGDPNGNALAPATISLTIAKAPSDDA